MREVSLDFLERLLASIVPYKRAPFLISLVKGWHRPERFDMNLRM